MIIHMFLDEQLAIRRNWYAHKQKPKLGEMLSTWMKKYNLKYFLGWATNYEHDARHDLKVGLH